MFRSRDHCLEGPHPAGLWIGMPRTTPLPASLLPHPSLSTLKHVPSGQVSGGHPIMQRGHLFLKPSDPGQGDPGADLCPLPGGLCVGDNDVTLTACQLYTPRKEKYNSILSPLKVSIESGFKVFAIQTWSPGTPHARWGSRSLRLAGVPVPAHFGALSAPGNRHCVPMCWDQLPRGHKTLDLG